MLRIAPEARYFSMPSAEAGWVVLSSSALNCWPCSRSTTHRPVASRCSPAVTEVVLPTTVTKFLTALDLHLEDGKTVLWVVVGDPLDQSGQGFGHGRHDAHVRGCGSLHPFPEAKAGTIVEGRLVWYSAAIWWRWAACLVTQATFRPEALQRMDVAMPEGTIKKLTDKGFGFIALPGGKDIFFHSSNLDGVEYEDLQEGQRVSFVEGRGPKGPRAEQVKPV